MDASQVSSMSPTFRPKTRSLAKSLAARISPMQKSKVVANRKHLKTHLSSPKHTQSKALAVSSRKTCRSGACYPFAPSVKRNLARCLPSVPRRLDAQDEVKPTTTPPPLPRYERIWKNRCRSGASLCAAPDVGSLGKCNCSSSCSPRSCLNAVMSIECTAANCSFEDDPENQCRNHNFSRAETGELDRMVDIFWTGPIKGFGLRATAAIQPGQLVAEYLGDVVPQETLSDWRYVMASPHGLAIDASRAGGPGRFINNSCKPNCEAQRWLLHNRFRVGLFAIRPIAANEELTFSYAAGGRGKCIGGAVVDPCFCGEEICTGAIAAPPTAKEKKLASAALSKKRSNQAGKLRSKLKQRPKSSRQPASESQKNRALMPTNQYSAENGTIRDQELPDPSEGMHPTPAQGSSGSREGRDNMRSKRCLLCPFGSEPKPFEEFSVCRNSSDARHQHCKTCHNQRYNQRRRELKEATKQKKEEGDEAAVDPGLWDLSAERVKENTVWEAKEPQNHSAWDIPDSVLFSEERVKEEEASEAKELQGHSVRNEPASDQLPNERVKEKDALVAKELQQHLAEHEPASIQFSEEMIKVTDQLLEDRDEEKDALEAKGPQQHSAENEPVSTQFSEKMINKGHEMVSQEDVAAVTELQPRWPSPRLVEELHLVAGSFCDQFYGSGDTPAWQHSPLASMQSLVSRSLPSKEELNACYALGLYLPSALVASMQKKSIVRF